MNIVEPVVTRYMNELASVDDSGVLLEMEALAQDKDFPIIGRLCGRALEVLARAIQAKRIFELGSGYGYSAYWFSRATGPSGEIHLTDMDPENEKKALDFLGRAGLAEPIHYHVSDGLAALDDTDGTFDIVYCDIDKGDYPRAWAAARERIGIGGLFICDNVLWSGWVTGASDEPDPRPGWTAAIDEMNRAITSDPAYRSMIVPARDGVIVAIRTA